MITGVTYMSHFFVVYVTAAVLFLRSRDRFVRWMTALVVLTVFGLLGYWLFPMAPPWMAANELHLIPDLARPGTRGLHLLHLTFVDRLWTHGANNSEMVNPVAAMPSLHAGYSMLFSWFFFKRTRRLWAKVLLAALPPGHGLHAGVRRRALHDRHPRRLAAGHPRRRAERPLPRLAAAPAGPRHRFGGGARPKRKRRPSRSDDPASTASMCPMTMRNRAFASRTSGSGRLTSGRGRSRR